MPAKQLDTAALWPGTCRSQKQRGPDSLGNGIANTRLRTFGIEFRQRSRAFPTTPHFSGQNAPFRENQQPTPYVQSHLDQLPDMSVLQTAASLPVPAGGLITLR